MIWPIHQTAGLPCTLSSLSEMSSGIANGRKSGLRSWDNQPTMGSSTTWIFSFSSGPIDGKQDKWFQLIRKYQFLPHIAYFYKPVFSLSSIIWPVSILGFFHHPMIMTILCCILVSLHPFMFFMRMRFMFKIKKSQLSLSDLRLCDLCPLTFLPPRTWWEVHLPTK